MNHPASDVQTSSPETLCSYAGKPISLAIASYVRMSYPFESPFLWLSV